MQTRLHIRTEINYELRHEKSTKVQISCVVNKQLLYTLNFGGFDVILTFFLSRCFMSYFVFFCCLELKVYFSTFMM